MASAPSAAAAGNAATSSTTNYPILKLIPLSQAQCAAALSLNTTNDNATSSTTNDDDKTNDERHIPPEVSQKNRPTLWLKLCSESDDIVDVDDSIDNPPEPTRYARMDKEGNYSCEVKLGRSEFAKIRWTKISRSLCDIGMTRTSHNDASGGSDNVTAWIKMRKGVDQHWVHLDGTLIVKPVNQPFHVKDGSILSLYGATGIAYRVKIEPNGAVINSPESVASRKRGATDTTTATNDNGDAKRHKHPGVRQGAQVLIENSTECPLCYEIFCKTVAVHPCGHNFCEECAETHLASINCTNDDGNANGKPTECPCCRGQIEGFTRNRLVDTMIWAVALNGCFDRDDAINYLKRRENAKMDAPSEEQKECILRCGKGEQDGIMNGNQMNGPVFMEPMQVTSSTKLFIPTLPTLSISQHRANLNNHSNEVVDLT